MDDSDTATLPLARSIPARFRGGLIPSDSHAFRKLLPIRCLVDNSLTRRGTCGIRSGMFNAIGFSNPETPRKADEAARSLLSWIKLADRRRLRGLLDGQASDAHINQALQTAVFSMPLVLVAFDREPATVLGMWATVEEARTRARDYYRGREPWIALSVSYRQFACWRRRPRREILEHTFRTPFFTRKRRS